MTSYGSLTNQAKNPKITISCQTSNGTSSVQTGGSIVIESTCDWSDKDTYTPALFSAYSGNAAYLLTNATQEPLDNALCKITLTYTAVSSSVPATTYAEQSSQVEEPIQQHPNFADWSDEWDDDAQEFLPSSSKYGIKSFIKGTTTVTVTSYYSSKPSSAMSQIGHLQAPGSDYGAAANWLLVGANRSLQGTLWVLQKVYLYSAVAYNTDIYTTG